MPVYPSNTKCAELGCKEPKSKLTSYCIKHGGRDNLPSRETDSIYQTPAWRQIRQRQLSLQPLCQACLCRGKIEAAQHVDHIFAWKHIGKHAFLHNIFQSLCQPDHSHKTALEKQGIYTYYTADGERSYSKDDYAYVVQQSSV